jgi:aminobenzoyl-glutamate transport protein
MSSPNAGSPTWFQRFLSVVERVGNLLPQPATLFALLAALVLVGSKIAASADLSVVHPVTQATIPAVDLLTMEGLGRMLTQAVPNLINFPPLGVVLVCLLGIAVAEHTGLIGAVLRLIVLAAPRKALTAIVVFAGVMSNAGGDIGYVLIIPLSAALFHTVGRHPMAGLAAAFAGVSGGFSANLLLGTIDVLLSGISTAAARLIDPSANVTALANYYFMAAATILITAVGAWVTERIVEPRLGTYQGDAKPESLNPLSPREKRGLVACAVTLSVLAALVVWGVAPADGFLRNPAKPDFFHSYFITGLVAFIFLFGLSAGLSYGLGAGTVRGDGDVVKGMDRSMATMASYLTLAFFAGQFVAYFNWTNLGMIFAVKGAEALKATGLGAVPLMVLVVLFTATINLIMGSASAKWTLLAPILVPMFMLLGYSPEFTQAAFRVGDSCTNIITPLMSYFPLILTFAHRYDPKAGIGTLIATMLPYSFAFLVAWTVMLVVWILTGAPLGPGAPLYLPTP